jgi:hypothetical protein
MNPATIIRLPAEVKARASGYASDLGVSFNALVAISLREYLDRHQPSGDARARPPAGPHAAAPVPPPAVAAAGRPVDPYALDGSAACRCGSGRRYFSCHFGEDKAAFKAQRRYEGS